MCRYFFIILFFTFSENTNEKMYIQEKIFFIFYLKKKRYLHKRLKLITLGNS